MKVVVCDLGQIEARLTAWICGSTVLLKQFADNLDPYSKLASVIFQQPVNRKKVGTIEELMGFIGKTGILGLGYGAGEEKFYTMVSVLARQMKMDISALGWSPALAAKSVHAYRTEHHQIPEGWRTLDQLLWNAWLPAGNGMSRFGPVFIGHGFVHLPNDMYLRYADPKQAPGTRVYKNPDGTKRIAEVMELVYRYGKMLHKLYGAKFLENIVQALARIIVMNAALRIRDRGFGTSYPCDYRFVLQAHDELVFIVHDSEVDRARDIIHTEMTRRPSWGRDIPLTADIGSGQSYGEAK